VKTLYNITLTTEEQEYLQKLISTGKGSARRMLHARILLRADTRQGQRKRSDQELAQMLDCGSATVFRVRRRFVEEGLSAAIEPRYMPKGITSPSSTGSKKRI
jgi:hypothetical protein